jgi:hypothetical protein
MNTPNFILRDAVMGLSSRRSMRADAADLRESPVASPPSHGPATVTAVGICPIVTWAGKFLDPGAL